MVRSAGPDQPLAPSSSRSLHSQVHDAASVARDRIHDVVSRIQRPEARSGLRDGWDALVKVVFAPCAGDLGGVPREDASASDRTSRAGRGRGSGGGDGPAWGASVPFEVSASQDRARSFRASSFGTQRSREAEPPGAFPVQERRTSGERREARCRARLKQLGARHQLAGEGPAAAARPVSPRRAEEGRAATGASYALGGAPGSPDLVDFDDGISAISSHTLEEMERRRLAREGRNVVRLSPKDFSQITDEGSVVMESGLQRVAILEESEERDTEVVFGDPFYEEDMLRNTADLSRVASAKSQRSRNTTVTEESNEFEEMYRRQEAMYWTDQDQVARSETNAGLAGGRPSRGMSIEERARRLRELSRSRSRSDGTGSVSAEVVTGFVVFIS